MNMILGFIVSSISDAFTRLLEMLIPRPQRFNWTVTVAGHETFWGSLGDSDCTSKKEPLGPFAPPCTSPIEHLLIFQISAQTSLL